MRILVVIDMQNDFIDGSLGTPEARAVVGRVIDKIKGFSGRVLFTRDSHGSDYLNTQEGRLLPVEHCLKGSHGWQIHPEIEALRKEPAIDKSSFGSKELAQMLAEMAEEQPVESITLVGLCTDICLIANALLLKAFLPETEIVIDAACCAGVTPESHQQALNAMKVCQVSVINEA